MSEFDSHGQRYTNVSEDGKAFADLFDTITDLKRQLAEREVVPLQHSPIIQKDYSLWCSCGWKSSPVSSRPQALDWRNHIRSTPALDAYVQEKVHERDGEWIDSIEEQLHLGIIPETMQGALDCLKAQAQENVERAVLAEHDETCRDCGMENGKLAECPRRTTLRLNADAANHDKVGGKT